jgi:hypothetical protein
MSEKHHERNYPYEIMLEDAPNYKKLMILLWLDMNNSVKYYIS